MKSFCIGVLAGSLLSLFLPIVPPFFAVFLLLLLFFILPATSRMIWLGICAYGLSLSWQYQQYVDAQHALLATNTLLTGTVVGTPRHYAEYSRFTLQIEQGTGAGYRVALSWNSLADSVSATESAVTPTIIQSGQRWQFRARLRPVSGVANPAGPNREAQALLDGVLAQGSVDSRDSPVLLAPRISLRQQLLQQIEPQMHSLETAAILRALTVGEREFSREQWLGLQNSGLAHLLAISGLHIGLVFGWSMLLLRAIPYPITWLAYRAPFSLCLSLLLALGYAWLAGFAIPTLRAVAALLILVIALLLKRRLSLSQYWLLLCATLLLVQPFYLLSKSFWLSVLAVAVIFLLLWQTPLRSGSCWQKLWLFLRFHLLLSAVMTVLSILMFNGSATVALISNLLFVPWCTVVALPLLLLTLLLTLLGVPGVGYLWQLSDLSFAPLQHWLALCVEYHSWLAIPDWPLLLSVLLIVMLLMLMVSRKLLYLPVLMMLLVSLLLSVLRPVSWQLHLLDVGQGLAVLLQHNERGVLYDAGPRYGSQSATAAVVLPFLRQRGVTQLDYLILSHDDSDHTGDWPLLQAQYPELTLVRDFHTAETGISCQALPEDYYGARLLMLPVKGSFNGKNDNSCVLLLDVMGWKILLPGDIGRHVEKQLLQRYPALHSHVLLLSHHGSNGSNDFSFLHQLRPQLALNSASLYNRHQHPSAEVLLRLNMLGIPVLNTAQSGAIELQITEESLVFRSYRDRRLPFWL